MTEHSSDLGMRTVPWYRSPEPSAGAQCGHGEGPQDGRAGGEGLCASQAPRTSAHPTNSSRLALRTTLRGFGHPRATEVRKCEVESSRNKEFVSFKCRAVPRSVTTSRGTPALGT